MSLILSLECSTGICSAALHKEGELVIVAEVHEKQSHGEKLSPLIKNLLDVAGVTVSALDAIAVSSGPGSYTGLRIGTSTAKGMCVALDIPLLAVDVLTIMASKALAMGFKDALLCPMLDARRMEVYCALYNSSLQLQSPIEAKVIDETSFADKLGNERIIFFGEGSDKCREVITSANASFISDIYPSSKELGFLAHQRFLESKIEDLTHFEPLYLKEFAVKKSAKLERVLNK